MQKRPLLKLTVVVCALLAMSILAKAQQEDKTVRVRFKRGVFSATYKDSVSHSVNTYLVRARKGQTMTISISAPANNASFNVGIKYENAGDVVELANERKRWTAKLDETGEYQISVLAVRGSASYSITFSVR